MLIEKVRQSIQSHCLIEKGDRIVLGISGGADSICLALLLLELKKEMEFEIYGVHLNHKIRGEAAKEDADFVKRFCRERDIPFFYFEREILEIAKREKISEEEAGRKERYACFHLVLDQVQGNKIAVAHHQNDQAETMLLHLVRGSGLQGMAGMRYRTNQVIRPLLGVSREEIEEYLRDAGMRYQEDETNDETIYARNKIRKQVIPELRKVNFKAVEHMANACELFGEAVDFIEGIVTKEYKRQIERQGEEYRICLKTLDGQPIFLQKQLIKKMIEEAAEKKKDIASIHVNEILSLCSKGVGKRVMLPYQLEARREYDSVVIKKVRKKKTEEEKGEYRETLREGKYFLSNSKIEVDVEKKLYSGEEILKKAYTKYFDCDKIKSDLVFRHRKTGDYFTVNAQGSKKLLKRFFIDEKIPKEERDKILLLAEENHILWIVGWRISEYYKITEKTREIIKVEINP